MGSKEFSKKLGELITEATKEGIMQGRMTFSQVIGTLEMAKMDIHNFAQGIAEQQRAEKAKETNPVILVPEGFQTQNSELKIPN